MPEMDELIEIAIAAADNINDMDVSLDALIGAAVRAVVPVVREEERNRILDSGCPFDRIATDIEPEDPCPVCGDLGTFDDNAPPSRCITRPAAIRARDTNPDSGAQ